ncbi:MAG: WD40 repeat domain-containing protein [Oligoflexia bacterium]|nr:WD40 repeat domain-containing protein [Oligoflexia bacterium]
MAGIIIIFILMQLITFSIENYRHRESWQSCQAPGSGSADSFNNYALWFAGKQPVWRESYIFRSRPDFNPFLTKTSLAFHPKGNTLVSAGGDGYIKFWNRVGEPLGEPINAQQEALSSIAFSPNGKVFATGGWDGTIRLWNIDDHSLKLSIQTGQIAVSAVAFTPEGTQVISGGWDGTLRLWTLDGKSVGEPMRGHESSISGIAFSPDQKIIASSSMDWSVRLWTRGGKFVSKIIQEPDSVEGVVFRKNGSLLAGAINANVIDCSQKGDIGKWECHSLFQHMPYQILGIALSPDQTTIALAGGMEDGAIHLWLDKVGTQKAKDLEGHSNSVTAVVFSPDGQLVAGGARDGGIRIWNVNGNLVKDISAHKGFEPGKTFGLPHFLRQAAYPFLISLGMRATGAYNACSTRFFQPLILALFILVVFATFLKHFGYLPALGLLIPFLDPTNHFSFYSGYNFSEFFLALLFSLIGITLLLSLFARHHRRRYLIACVLFIILACHIKQVSCIFVGFLVGPLLVLLFLTKKLKPLQFKNLMTALGVTAITGLTTMQMYPEGTLFNELLTYSKYFTLPAPANVDPYVDKFGRLQKLITKRYLEASHDPNLDPSKESWAGAGSEFINNTDAHPIIDTKTGEVIFFRAYELPIIGKILKQHNPLFQIRYGIKETMSKLWTLKLKTYYLADHPVLEALWLLIVVLGIVILWLRYRVVTSALVLMLVGFYLFLSFAYFVEERYMQMFTGYYYAAFAFGFTFIVQKSGSALSKLRIR